MFRRKRRGRHAAPTPTSAYVVRGVLVAGTAPIAVLAAPSAAFANTGSVPIVEVPASTGPAPTEYVVQSGDTLSKIARANGTTTGALAAVNGIANADKISVGQRLSLGDTPIFTELAASNDARSVAFAEAQTYLDVPYDYGGTSRSGIDCSGLVLRAYEAAGIELPRNSAAQAAFGTRISESEARVGDLVAFNDGGGIHHIGLVAGDGLILHAPRAGKDVQVSKIWRGETVTFYRVA